MPDEVLAACPALKVIVFMGTGAASFIDVQAAEKRGIVVRTISGYGDRSVAEHAVALMFAAVRQIATMDRAVRDGDWQTLDGIELQGRTLGVVGTGGIGREMIKLGAALGMTVLAWNRSGVPDDLPCAPCTLDAVMSSADVVSLHLGLNDETKGMIDERRIGLMQPHAALINTARGAVLDEAALIRALKAKRIAHAGLDVFDDEPLPAGHPLTTLDNVTLTGHAAFMTKEASERLLTYAFTYMRDELAKIEG
jgi:D-3-phosphoglycerate dehydrogenase